MDPKSIIEKDIFQKNNTKNAQSLKCPLNFPPGLEVTVDLPLGHVRPELADAPTFALGRARRRVRRRQPVPALRVGQVAALKKSTISILHWKPVIK